MKYQKLDVMKNEKFKQRDYIRRMNMHDARLNFRIRTKMINCKMNQSSDRKNKETLWKCDGCGNIDSRKHILWCPAFRDLRKGKSMDSDTDIIDYFRKVLKIREKLNLYK